VELRTSESPQTLTNTVRGAVAELDPLQAVYQVQTVRSQIDLGLGSISLLGTLLGAFAALGLALAAIGIYGVTSYSVAQRTGEIGIRVALGAPSRSILWLVLGNGARLSFLGTLLGVAGGYPLARILEALIPTLPTRDPIAFVVISIVLVVVALTASYLPAKRATRVDPMVALRTE